MARDNDEGLIERVRQIAERDGVDERLMFGSQSWFAGGNLACGVRGDTLLVRLGPDAEQALETEHVEPFAPYGDGRKPMSGYVVVGSAALEDEAELEGWVEAGIGFAASLPPK